MLKCTEQGTESKVPELRRGRKPQACEHCFKSKVLCDKGNPCARCRLRHLPCRRRGQAGEISKPSPSVMPDTLRIQSFQTETVQQQPQSLCHSTSSFSGGTAAETTPPVTTSMQCVKAPINPTADSRLERIANNTANRILEPILDKRFLQSDWSSSGEKHLLSIMSEFMELFPWAWPL